MIQYYLDLEKQVKDIKDKSLSEGQIQKIYSTAYYISFSIRAPGKTWFLYLGRGGGHEGIWLHESPPPSEIRRKDNFLEYFRRYLSSCSFISVSLDQYDRIIKMDYRKFGKIQSFLWFWKGRKLYFVHYYLDQPESPYKLLLSWRGKAFTPGNEVGDLFEYFDEIGRHHDMNHDMQSKEISFMDKLLAEEMKSAAIKESTSAPTFLQRKKENIEGDLRRARQWEKLQNILDKGQDLDMYELKVGDHKIKFEGELNPYERRNLLFQKIKKLKRGESILRERLGDVEEELAGKKSVKVQDSKIPMIKPIWGEEKQTSLIPVKISPDHYKIYKFENFQVGVGLNSQGNDQLRNKWASREDHWLHLDNLKSSHVIIKLLNNTPLTPDILNTGATIVAYFSHFIGDWIPIIHTQVKNLKGVSGAAGMVTYKKEKHLTCPKVELGSLIKE
ncbi:MAG: NFACT RNA binding domain-containing protein [Bacteriovoracia bacterium]